MRENVISALIIFGVLALVGILWFAYENPVLNPRLQETSYTIIRKWEMPQELEEISGIHYFSKNRMACVQDEDGIIFIYNLNTDRIEKRINFGKPGDYEGLTIIDTTAFIVKSDGKIFELANFSNEDYEAKIYSTSFSGRNNIESLEADSINNRLLLSVKDADPNSKEYKGIYAFDLETKELLTEPVYTIPMDDPIFKNKSSKDDKEEAFYPSDLAINPIDGNIYILEGKDPHLLIMDKSGKLIQLHKLNKESFPQPEGITFSPDGALYISNEGKKGTANILEVQFESKR